MDATAADRGAFAEAVVFLSYFDDLPDPRQRGKRFAGPAPARQAICRTRVSAASDLPDPRERAKRFAAPAPARQAICRTRASAASDLPDPRQRGKVVYPLDE